MTGATSGNGCRRIGFVDYRLDNFHADVFLKSIHALRDDRGYSITGAFALDSTPSAEWASVKGVEFFHRLDELNSHVDCYMILAPSNPEVHLDLCRQVFPFGKTTYVDKTFAPSLETAAAIFELADRNGVAIQTTSALRYTQVQSAVVRAGRQLRHLAVWGGGTSIGEYAIHPVELVVSSFGVDATDIAVVGAEDYLLVTLQFKGGRTATIHLNTKSHVPYRAALSTRESTEFITVDDSNLFLDTASAILDFFDAGVARIDREESLLVREILDCIQSSRRPAGWMQLKRDGRVRRVPRPKGLGRRPTVGEIERRE